MNDEIILALSQNAQLFLRFEHVQEINTVIRKRQRELVMDLSYKLYFAGSDVRMYQELVNKRWNIFRWFDRKDLERAQKRYDAVVDMIHAAGLTLGTRKESEAE